MGLWGWDVRLKWPKAHQEKQGTPGLLVQARLSSGNEAGIISSDGVRVSG